MKYNKDSKSKTAIIAIMMIIKNLVMIVIAVMIEVMFYSFIFFETSF